MHLLVWSGGRFSSLNIWEYGKFHFFKQIFAANFWVSSNCLISPFAKGSQTMQQYSKFTGFLSLSRFFLTQPLNRAGFHSGSCLYFFCSACYACRGAMPVQSRDYARRRMVASLATWQALSRAVHIILFLPIMLFWNSNKCYHYTWPLFPLCLLFSLLCSFN